MARKSIFRRIADVIGRLFEPEPPSRPAPPPSPPRRRPGGSGGGGGYRGIFREIWDEEVPASRIADMEERTGYSENELFQLHYEILYSLDPETDQDTREEMWEDYLQGFVNNNMTHDRFFNIWNIDPRDFSWALWRDAMGYGNKK